MHDCNNMLFYKDFVLSFVEQKKLTDRERGDKVLKTLWYILLKRVGRRGDGETFQK